MDFQICNAGAPGGVNNLPYRITALKFITFILTAVLQNISSWFASAIFGRQNNFHKFINIVVTQLIRFDLAPLTIDSACSALFTDVFRRAAYCCDPPPGVGSFIFHITVIGLKLISGFQG